VLNKKMIKSRWLKPAQKGQAFADLDEYYYQRLPTSSSIRVLEHLTAIQEKHHLWCKLHVIDHEEIHADYTALSYAWGDTYLSIRIAIECDGCKIAITPILSFSTQRIRNPFKQTAFVWADGLCINQGTAREALHERGSQIAMRRNIYSKACFVLVELGSHRWDAFTVKNLERYAQNEEYSWRAAAAVSKNQVISKRLGQIP
jgi:hypothetical protein